MSEPTGRRVWIVFARWPGNDEWLAVYVANDMGSAKAFMNNRYAGTLWERRIQPARVER